jgi:hypothetical protein
MNWREALTTREEAAVFEVIAALVAFGWTDPTTGWCMGCGHDWVEAASGLHRHPELCAVAAAREALGQPDAQADGFVAVAAGRESKTAFRDAVDALQGALHALRKARSAERHDD